MAVDKKNIFLTHTMETMPYVSSPRPMGSNFPKRVVASHAAIIERKLKDCYVKSLSQKQVAAIRYKEGVYLEFSGASEHDLAIKSLENRTQGIRLLNVHEDTDSNTVKATVYIPAGKENYFLKKVEAYATEQTKTGKPKNNDLVSSIEDVKLAILESFWVGSPTTMPSEQPIWCELWLRFDYESENPNSWAGVEENVTSICRAENIPIDEKHIVFPERIVKLIFANSDHLKLLIDSCPFITEIRRAQEATSFFEELTNNEQKEWIKELLSRTSYEKSNISVCLLDTGVTSSHPLLSPAIDINHIQAVDSAWGNGDHQGHGSEMAGIALFGDLKEALISQKHISIPQEIESVKILPPTGSNLPELYGAITEQAVSIAEIANPTAQRIICMAVTASDYNTFDGSPIALSELHLQHLTVLAADIVEAVVAVRNADVLLKDFGIRRHIHERQFKVNGTVKKVQEGAPLFEDRGLVFLLGQLIVDVLILDGLGIILVADTANAIREHTLERDRLLRGAGNTVITPCAVDDLLNLPCLSLSQILRHVQVSFFCFSEQIFHRKQCDLPPFLPAPDGSGRHNSCSSDRDGPSALQTWPE